MSKRIKKKHIIDSFKNLEKEVSYLRQQSNSIVEMLKASGLIEALDENEDMVTIRRNVLGVPFDTHYKVNEVF